MILILGGMGETGSWFACYLKEKGFDVVVKAGRCDASVLRDLADSRPYPPQDYCAASISRHRVSGSCGRTAPGYESRAMCL